MNPPLNLHVEVGCSCSHAFKVFTEKVDVWWPPGHRRRRGSTLQFEPFIGGRFLEVGPGDEFSTLGEVMVWQPPERLVYTWYPGSQLGPTQVEIHFYAQGNLTRVEVTHSEGASQLGPIWNERVKRFNASWNDVLPSLALWIKNNPEI